MKVNEKVVFWKGSACECEWLLLRCFSAPFPVALE